MNDIINSEQENSSFSFRKEINGVTKAIYGEKAENGWVVRIEKSWYEKTENGNKDYKCSNKSYIMKENPLEKIKSKVFDAGDMIASLFEDDNHILVN
jgi:hypothetical protein